MPDEEGSRVGRPDPSLELLARAAQAVHGTTDVDAAYARGEQRDVNALFETMSD